jgi:ribosome biogenesis GTPase A
MSSSWSTNINEVVIGVVGVTGSGKSSFIKRVTQRSDIRTSTDTESGKSITLQITHEVIS